MHHTESEKELSKEEQHDKAHKYGSCFCTDLPEYMGWYLVKNGGKVKLRPSISITNAFVSSKSKFEEEEEVREGEGGKGTRNPQNMKTMESTMREDSKVHELVHSRAWYGIERSVWFILRFEGGH